MTDALVATMTNAHDDPAMTVDDETEMLETTSDVAAPETPTLVAANPECRAALNDAPTVTVTVTVTASAELLVRDLEMRAGPASALQLEAAATAHAHAAPKSSTDTSLEAAKSLMTRENANEMAAATGNEAIAANASKMTADSATVTIVANARVASDRESTIAGTREMGVSVRIETRTITKNPPNDRAASKTQIVTCPEVVVMTTRILAARTSVIAKRGKEAKAGAGVEIGTAIGTGRGTETETETQGGAAADRGVEIVETGDVARRHLHASWTL